jgi:hypothetical protein
VGIVRSSLARASSPAITGASARLGNPAVEEEARGATGARPLSEGIGPRGGACLVARAVATRPRARLRRKRKHARPVPKAVTRRARPSTPQAAAGRSRAVCRTQSAPQAVAHRDGRT